MDEIIKKIITLAIPGLYLWMMKSGIGTAFFKLNIFFGSYVTVLIVIFLGLAAYYFSEVFIDGLLLRYYQKRFQSESAEKLINEIEKLPISLPLKIQLKWSILHHPIHKGINLRKIPRRGFFLITIFTALFSLTGYLGLFNQIFELTSHFKFQYFIIGCCTLFFWIITRQKILALVSLGCILLNLFVIIPWYLPSSQIIAGDQVNKIRILQLNVLFHNQQYSQVIALVKKENPDVAVFQEVSEKWDKKLKALQQNYPYVFHNQDNPRFGKSIYSKIPLENSNKIITAKYQKSKIRRSLVTQLKVPGKPISLIVTHLTIPTKRANFKLRNQELELLADYVSKLQSPIIVVGDFNTSIWSPYYHQFVNKTGLINGRGGFGIQPSWPTFLPLFYIPIDHCLVSPEIQVLNSQIGKDVGSDHLPVITDVAISQKAKSS
ncbi:MAG: endonuclease/exonuclease/phosphatase family protein [Cyanobacteria bacterium P01_H01_bin.35]